MATKKTSKKKKPKKSKLLETTRVQTAEHMRRELKEEQKGKKK